MSTDWRKLMRLLAILVGAYLVALSIVADFAQVLTLKYSVPLLALLFVVVLVYMGWEQGKKFRDKYRALQTKLNEVRDFLRRYGDNVLLCALTHWLFEQHVDSIRVINTDELEAGRIIILNVSQVPLRSDDHLDGMHFAITGPDGGERAKGKVILCDSKRAHLELSDNLTEAPRKGDLAVPIEPPQATELEQLLGHVLFIVRE